ncbi:MAG: RNase adapter RapZ, partial [Bacteroidota bacterium]|nr:RNase adapter RapZ [Bacteroidota bacterium]
IIQYYQNVIEELVRFQIEFSKDIDYSVSYPRDKFDKQSMMWDLNYFKYYFLKLGEIKFDEQSLENDFNKFTDFLLNENHDYFLYRDFQSRNIMIFENKPYFIDYQGGRKGALQYDIASLIFDAKANIPTILKTQLLEYYIECLGKYTIVDKAKFINYYYGYCLLRIMQAMGAYGYRGFYEKKEHFLTSIPFAVNNLNNILKNNHPAVELPELDNCWNQIIQSTHLRDIVKSVTNLNVHIQSFSYRKGIPVDEFGNGGGFVFDCRFIKNPGLFQEYKNLTGNDFEVIDFLNKEAETDEFLENIYSIIDKAVEKYKQKNYNHLMVSFGCTGGQHRSVHCANMLYRHLHKQNDINVFLKHREI